MANAEPRIVNSQSLSDFGIVKAAEPSIINSQSFSNFGIVEAVEPTLSDFGIVNAVDLSNLEIAEAVGASARFVEVSF